MTAVLPVYNRPASVARAIDSVLAQTYRNIELIIVDDGSTDETSAIIDRYNGAATILRQDNSGVYAARNLALRHARGEFVAFIDSDDAWLADKVERQVPLMRPEVGLVFGDIEILSAPRDDAPRSRFTGFAAVTPHRGNALEGLAWGNFVPTCTALVRRSALEEIGGFDSESRVSADYLAWFRIAQRHAFDYVEVPVSLYTLHEDGISYDLGRALAARIALFHRERAIIHDRETRRVVDTLLFNLGIHLALAAIRGRASTVKAPFQLARTAAGVMDTRLAIWSMAAFVTNQLRLRAKRLMP